MIGGLDKSALASLGLLFCCPQPEFKLFHFRGGQREEVLESRRMLFLDMLGPLEIFAVLLQETLAFILRVFSLPVSEQT